VNQDTGWDIPASPEPGVKDGVPVWKPNVNNGKEPPFSATLITATSSMGLVAVL
jgi:hypothetical protein